MNETLIKFNPAVKFPWLHLYLIQSQFRFRNGLINRDGISLLKLVETDEEGSRIFQSKFFFTGECEISEWFRYPFC